LDAAALVLAAPQVSDPKDCNVFETKLPESARRKDFVSCIKVINQAVAKLLTRPC
jgi:hypothetical protein